MTLPSHPGQERPTPPRSESATAPGSSPGSPSGDPRASLVVGVLGGIASGKSAAAQAIAGADGLVIDADRIAHEVLDSPGVRAHLLTEFGGRVFGKDGLADRAALARRVFASQEDRELLESFTHPPIRARIRAALERARTAGIPRIVLDVPLLLENESGQSGHGLAAECDGIVFVDADDAARDARAVSSRGWKPGEVFAREAAQMPLAEKRARADRVIENRGTLEDLERAAREVAAEIAPR